MNVISRLRRLGGFIHFVTRRFTSGYPYQIRSGFFNLSCFNAHIDKVIVFSKHKL